jgi:hypothetical protein
LGYRKVFEIIMPSVSKKQHNFMAAVAKNPAFAKKVGMKSSVGEEFLKADKGRKFREGGMAKESMKEDIAQDKKLIKRAFKMHDAQEHKGGKGTNLAKLRKGGMAMKKAKRYEEGGEVEFETKQGKNSMISDETRRKAMEQADSDIEAEPKNAIPPKPSKGPSFASKAKKAGFVSSETKGGAALMTRKMASGGKVRGCGIASKGLTKGKIV